MKNLKTYDQFLFEDVPSFGYDGCQLQVGKSVISRDGFSGIIVSKESVNGKVQYRDHNGVIRICESYDLVEYNTLNEADLTWWEVAKGILAADAIRAGVALAGGGILVAGYMFANWRKSIANKIESIRRDQNFQELKDKAASIADKFNGDSELTTMLSQLAQYPYTDTLFTKGKREKSKAESNNRERSRIMREIAKYVKSKLNDDEKDYFTQINKILRDKPLTDEQGKKIEEDVMSDTNRMVGTGTYTPVSGGDQNFMVKAPSYNADSSGGDSTFFT
jgi:hypothetical protein